MNKTDSEIVAEVNSVPHVDVEIRPSTIKPLSAVLKDHPAEAAEMSSELVADADRDERSPRSSQKEFADKREAASDNMQQDSAAPSV